MKYLSSYQIYQVVIDEMESLEMSREEFAQNIGVTLEELEDLLDPMRDYTISEIKLLLDGLYLDIKIDFVPE